MPHSGTWHHMTPCWVALELQSFCGSNIMLALVVQINTELLLCLCAEHSNRRCCYCDIWSKISKRVCRVHLNLFIVDLFNTIKPIHTQNQKVSTRPYIPLGCFVMSRYKFTFSSVLLLLHRVNTVYWRIPCTRGVLHVHIQMAPQWV